MLPPGVRYLQQQSCATGQRGLQELPCHSLPSLNFAGWDMIVLKKWEEEQIFIIVLVGSVGSLGLEIFGCFYIYIYTYIYEIIVGIFKVEYKKL